MRSSLAEHSSPQLKTPSSESVAEEYCNPKYPEYAHHPLGHLLAQESGVPSINVPTAEDKYYAYQENPELVTPIKTIAFYLPQFHPFRENDTWWGKGFTEWSNVGKATSVFNGHHQPHCPIHLGYYDLRIIDNMIEQATLAKNYGIHGFSYYFYWFDGITLMEAPLRGMLGNSRVDIPFCLTWANENWTRRWDGQESDVLISQNHSLEDSRKLFEHLIPYFKDKRYIRNQDCPVFIVYRPDIIPSIKETTDLWRKLAIEAGFEGLYLVGCQTFGIKDIREHGFDAAVEFPPHAIGSPDISAELECANRDFTGHIYDYRKAARSKIDEGVTNYRKHYTCMLSWDNTARKGLKSHIFARFSLSQYQDWLSSNISKTLRQARYSDDYPLYTFINAWNEWAEGTHLEPDRKYGYGYLQSTYDILGQHTTEKKDLDFLLRQTDPRDNKAIQKENCAIVHCHYLETLPRIANRLKRLPDTFDIYVSTTNLKLAIQVKESNPEFIVEVTPNIGRDIGPFLHTLRSIEDASLEYNACLKVHTKKSAYRNDGSQLREKLLDQLFMPSTISQALSTLEHNGKSEDIGLICPKDFLKEHADVNGYRLKYHMKAIDEIESATGIIFHQSVFPAGSMFWFRQKALRRLLHIPMSWFDPEIGLADGTMAHTIERIFATIVQFDGYRVIPTSD